MHNLLVVPQLSPQNLAEFLSEYKMPQRAIIANVRNETIFNTYLEIVKQKIDNVLTLDAHTPTPLRNLYQTPQTLGSDRLAAAIGAYALYPQRNVLVINAGTALTFELVSKQAEYMGGSISLGLRSRYKALHWVTDKLPLYSPAEQTPHLGQNTRDAVTSGVQNGMLYEMQGVIAYFMSKYPHLQTILTGGDAVFFAHRLQNVSAVPHLTLIGLNSILDYN
jgi:type III pantothenate kinase